MSRWEFLQLFKYKLALIPTGEPNERDYEVYFIEFAKLRSELIKMLRSMGFPGNIRASYNRAIEKHSPDYKRYLYKISKDCALCGYPIATIDEATIDHIIPKALGGPNGICNQQLAHGPCNVKKGCEL